MDDITIGRDLYYTGHDITWCENADQEWGWLLQREEETGIPSQ